MKDVIIKTKSIPAQPRSKNYPTGASVVRSSSGNTTIIPGSSGDSVDIVKEIDIKSLTDKNVLSSLRTLLEIRSRIIATDNTETELSEENTLSSLRALEEIDKSIKSVLQTVDKTYLNKTKPDTAQKVITFLEGLTSDGFVEVNSGLIVRSSKKTTSLSNALIEDSNKDSISYDLIEEEENVENLSTSLLEVTTTGGGGTLGTLDNTDESFDTITDGTYVLQKRGGIYYPAKGSSGGGGTKMTLSFVSGSAATVALGKDAVIKYSFTSTLDGEDTGQGTVTYTVNNKLIASDNINQGEVSFNAGKYLLLGENTLVVQVTDTYGSVRKLTYKINAVSISITSTFDDTKAYIGTIPFVYTPVGAVEKTIHFKIDGKEIGTFATSISNRQQTYSIPVQTHGSHLLDVYMTATVDGISIESEHLYFGMICMVDGNNTPIIASSFRTAEIEQFETLIIPFLVYSPSSTTSSVMLSANGTVVSEQSVGRTRQTWSYRAEKAGELALKIVCGSVSKTFNVTVRESEINVQPESQDLELFLTSRNRDNNEVARAEWEYNGISSILSGFNWKTNGWVKDVNGYSCLRVGRGSTVNIPLKLFANDFRTTGKTIEFEFLVRDVYRYDTPVISCWSDNRGIQVTSQKAVLKSEQSEITTMFKDEERIRLAFVVEKRADNRLLGIYVNGIKSGSMQYPAADNFMQAVPVNIIIGGTDATVDVYNIRSYSNNLNRYQLLDNYIADMDNLELKRKLYSRNQIYDDYGNVDFEKINRGIATLTIIGDLPQYKGDKKVVSIVYTDYSNPAKSWNADNVKINVQGTSSQYYPRKNYKFELTEGITYIESGMKADKYQVTEDVLPAKIFCIKTDFAESSGTHNTGVANMADRLLKEMNILTEAQKENVEFRTTVAGKPAVLFHKANADSTAVFVGKINFNTDKAAEDTFGFKPGDESWEFLNNTSDLALFKSADFTKWQDTIEARYPDGGADITNVKKVFDWIVSCKGNPAKFKTECKNYFDKDTLVFYALITLVLGMTDQRAKNMFLTRYRGKLWLFILYDNDTLLPINNEGLIALLYNVETRDIVNGANVWNGADSELWTLVDEAFAEEMKGMYYTMRQKNILSYDRMMDYLYNRQADKWCEAIYNEDGYYKYEQPLIEGYLDYSQSHENPQTIKTGAYLYALQGSREMYGKWIWKNRFLYLDSKFLSGSILGDTAVFRTYTPTVWAGVKPCADITLTAFNAMYFNVKWGSVTKSQRVGFNETFKMTAPEGMQFNDTETIVYGASLIASLGDLSPLYPGTVDVSKMIRLKELIVGSTINSYRNNNLHSLYIGENRLLRLLNMSNCPNYTQPIDVSGCDNLEELYAQGSSATAVLLPPAGILHTMHLPSTIASLTLLNQINLTDDGLVLDGIENISTIRIEGTDNVNAFAIINRCLALGTPKLERVRLINVSGQGNSLDTLVRLSKLKGLDENGDNIEKAVITGKYHAVTVTQSKLAAMRSTFPELEITYVQLKPDSVTTITFRSSQSKAVANAIFECNFDFEKVNEYTYKITAQDNETISFTFKCDNHVEYINTYLVSGTRTQNYIVTYIPLHAICINVYGQHIYPQGAVVNINGKKYLTDKNGYVYYRGGESITGEVSALGYTSNTFSFDSITNDTAHVVYVYIAVEVKFIVKGLSDILLEGATVQCAGETGTTNLYGECVLLIGKGDYDYTVTCTNYFESKGSVTIGTSAKSINVSMLFNMETFKPAENGNIQMYFKGLTAGFSIKTNGTTCIINWGDGTTENANGMGTIYKHTYNADDFYQVEISNCKEVSYCSPAGAKLVAYWSIGNSKTKNLSFGNDKDIVYVGDIFKNDTERTDFSQCLSGCSSLVSFHSGLFDSCEKATSFRYCFGRCGNLTSIPEGLFDNCPEVTNFNGCFNGCYSITSIPERLFDNCLNIIDLGTCFYQCSGLREVPANLFKKCRKITDFSWCFNYCNSIITIPVGLFDNCPEVTNFSGCFTYCTKLTSIPNGLFDNCSKVTTFSSCFARCGNLTSIPEGLFDNCPEVTNFSECFYVCESARKLPELWLKFYNSSVKREKCFEQCIRASNYSSVPVSWGGTAPEYVPPVVASGVSLADYRAINARLSNIEEKLNLN